MDIPAAAAAERRDLADFLTTLTDAEWRSPSLCEGWSVRDVVAHVCSYADLAIGGMPGRVLRGRGLPDRMNAVGVEQWRDRDPGDLIAHLRAHATPSGFTAAFGGRLALVDTLIHHQDIRRPLGRPREVPADRLRVALPFAYTAPVVRGFWHVRGVRVRAADVEWSAGLGPIAEGPAEAVLMVVAGRRGAATELTGPGAAVLRARSG